MSLVRRSLSFSSCRIVVHPSYSGWKHRRGFARVWLRTQPADFVKQAPLRVANVSLQFEIGEASAAVSLNEVAPPVSNVFSTATKQVTILEDPAGFFRNRVDRKVQIVKQALQSVEEAVAPSPFSPAQGDDAVAFFLISVFLILAFWVGNYVAPTWIFKDTVFRNAKENGDDDGEEEYRQSSKPSDEPEVDPADLIELPPNFQPLRGIVVDGFKAGRQRAREQAGGRKRKKRPEKRK